MEMAVQNNLESSSPSPSSSTALRDCVSTGSASQSSLSPAMNGVNGSAREPDADSIKMFVGQIPRDWTEDECRTLFSEFGDIYSLNVLRDKTDGRSRGCCFVTFYTRKSALEAQNALHNIRTLIGMHHPIQMKPADSENRNERKLFVGMLDKKYTEHDVRVLFSAFGCIEECTVLRDVTGLSKGKYGLYQPIITVTYIMNSFTGCAFVTFSTRNCAVNAIKAMNHSQTLPGCSSPLVVKFADTQKDKDARRQQQILMQQLAAATVQPTPSATASLAAAAANPYLALAAAAAANAAAQQQHQQHQQVVQQQQHLAAATLALQQQLASNPDPLTLAAVAALASNPMMLASFSGANASHTGSTGASTPSTASHMNGGSDLYGPSNGPGNGHAHPSFGALSAFQNQAATLAQLAAVTGQGQQQHHPPATSSPLNGQQNGSGNKQMEGPDGANLFIYHLPAEFGDTDLAAAFGPFGHVLSSKVFIDKQTNLSKCFGFVSYDNPLSAQTAIQSMNGFQIGTKRLKVQLKRSKDKPY